MSVIWFISNSTTADKARKHGACENYLYLEKHKDITVTTTFLNSPSGKEQVKQDH